MIFSLPFSATAIANVDFAGARSGIPVAIVFGSLWILREGSTLVKKSNIWHSEHIQTSVRRLRFFMIVVALSLAMPLWINGRLTVECPDLGCSDSGPLDFNARHVTQTLYLAYGLIITIFIALRNSDLSEFRKTVRVFLASSIFVSFWGHLKHNKMVGMCLREIIPNRAGQVCPKGHNYSYTQWRKGGRHLKRVYKVIVACSS